VRLLLPPEDAIDLFERFAELLVSHERRLLQIE
jgi:hypothetical protein